MGRDLLDNSSSVVLYRQLADVLKQYFCDSHMPVGKRLPTEFELSAKYGVSRGTVRQALGLLEEEGLLERVPGLGTFLKKEVNKEAHQGNLPHQLQIGLIVPFAQDQLSLNILIGVESVAKYRGYQVVFSHSNENMEQEKADIARMVRDKVAGFIIFPCSNSDYDEAIWQLNEEKVPFVLVDRFFPDLDCDYVVADNLGGGYRATEHLILLGHKEIGFVYHSDADIRYTTSVRDRYEGYRKALEDYHLDFKESWRAPLDNPPFTASRDDALLPYMAYLSQKDRPNAVLVVNDTSAISLIAAAGRLGINVPDDLAVVGFDNIKMAAQIQVPLTTINQQRTELGIRATHLLLGRIDGLTGPSEHIVIPTDLVIRESCGARRRLLGKSS